MTQLNNVIRQYRLWSKLIANGNVVECNKTVMFLLKQEVIAIANQRHISSPGSRQVTPSPSSLGLDKSGIAVTPHLTKIGTIASSAPGTRAATTVSGLTDESVIGDIFGHYCGLVYQAILESIVSSLLVVGDCVKPPGRMHSGIEVESRKTSRFVANSLSHEKG